MTAHTERLRLRVTVRGAVQGVGFRPFIYRLATSLGLTGWVNNSSQGVFIEVEGHKPELERFLLRVGPEKPPRSFIQSLESSFLDPVGYTTFEIRASDGTGEKTTLVLPDIATCPDCLADILDPHNRRYRYPFTNCTNCGPRFSIIQALPYDRPNTTMRAFRMCQSCRAEYEDPLDRRFHAQPNACSECGPRLELWDAAGNSLAAHHEALLAAADAVRRGDIVAVKGLGGFHLVVDARNERSVMELARRKRREEKPFALMYPSLERVAQDCQVSELEERLLRSPEAPIVLLQRRREALVAPSVAPRNPYLGVMLPYTPLHHLLLRELGFPIVATSGNLSDEPICTDEREALQRLSGIAELFLVHDRPIARHVDDSIVRIIMGRETVMRRARGYAPLPVSLKTPAPPVLAVGAHLKNTIAVSVGRQAFVSQHIGDLETAQAFDAFQRVIASFRQLYEVSPTAVACDAHPNYLSTQSAAKYGLPVVSVQHHYAHLLACMAENELEGPVLGVSWDGTGYGSDGTVWGGEFLAPTDTSFVRVGHLRTFRLPGGEVAVHEPRRTALGLLYEALGDALFARTDLAPVQAFSQGELGVLRAMLARGVNAPVTSSAGRLFDAVASILGLRQVTRFEGQAAMELEYALDGFETDDRYEFLLLPPTKVGGMMPQTSVCGGGNILIVDWAPMLREILEDVERRVPVGLVSARFHNTLAEAIVAVAKRVGVERVVLTGGCFQNRYLTERTVRRLAQEGFRPYWHQRIPPNDGGIALGQLVAASRALAPGPSRGLAKE
ncbi:MAG: carbamoyltransferase HypF [Chloroflexota bacterium]|nr:carbamoyltransferase HypF [Chloroflexota bacterium]